MKRDRVTSIILICLVVSSIALTVKIWFSEELWPDGYNFFVNPENFISWLPFSDEESEETEAVAPLHETMFMPEKIVSAESISERSVYSGGEENFFILNDFSKNILKSLFTEAEETTEVSGIEYCDTVKGRVLYVEYPVNIPVKVLGHLCEINVSSVFSEISVVNGFAAVPSDSGCFVYMRDISTGKILRYSIPFDSRKLATVISDYALPGGDFMTAFELGFYKREDMVFEQKISFEPFVLIDTSKETLRNQVIRAKAPFGETEPSDISLDAIGKIVSAFGYNPNTIRRYTDSEGTLVLIEDYSTIKLYTNGVLEFTTTTPKKGINMQIHSVSFASPQNVLDTIDSLTEILGGVWNALDMGDMPDIRLGSEITDNYSDYRLSFDYRFDGNPVILSYGDAKHAIELEIKDNLLTFMKVYIRGYESAGEECENIPTSDALDRFCEVPDINPDAEDMFLGYIDYGTSGKIYTHWNIIHSGGEVFSLKR